MNDMTNNVAEQSSQQSGAAFITTEHSLYFRTLDDTPANRAAITKQYGENSVEAVMEEDDNGKEYQRGIRPKTIVFNLVLPNYQDNLVQTAVTEFAKKAVTPLLKPTPTKKNPTPVSSDPAMFDSWEKLQPVLIKAITASAAGEYKPSKEVLEAMAAHFGTYMLALDKPAAGVEIMQKMIKRKFSASSVNKYIEGLPMIQENLESWYAEGLDEEEQEKYMVPFEFLLKAIEQAQEPEEVNVGALFG